MTVRYFPNTDTSRKWVMSS